jgi:hypothetical protein
MNGYIAFYKGKQVEVYAEDMFKAQEKAAVLFKAKKRYEVTAILAEKNTDGTTPGEQVIHTPDF